MLAVVQEAVSGVVGSSVPPDTPLMSAGLDSLGAVELRNALEGRLGLQLPGTLVFDYPTVEAIAGYVAERVVPAAGDMQREEESEADEEAAGAVQLTTASSLSTARVSRVAFAAASSAPAPTTAVAVLATACRSSQAAISSQLALDATTRIPHHRYALQVAAPARCTWGNSCTAAMPSSMTTGYLLSPKWSFSCRWELQDQSSRLGPGGQQLPVQFGAFLSAVDLFDASAFGISAPEAALMDPQQRLLMEAAAEALSKHEQQPAAPAVAASAWRARTGTFVGVSSTDYNKLALQHTNIASAFASTGASLSVAAGRLAFTFGLGGTAVSVDTACSSSLVATHAALNAIALGQLSTALVAGANLTLTPDTPAAFQKAGMLSPEGRCKTLDAAADGYVRGEAVGVFVLGAYASGGAEAGTLPLAWIAGAAVNQDGRSSSLTAPNGPAQQAVLREALASANLAPELVASLQMHGTGTPLGDPIEVGAIAAVFAGSGRQRPLTLMASKSWVGHAEPAAGVQGLAQAALAVTHGSDLELMHLRSLNSYVSNALDGAATAAGPMWRMMRQRAPRPALASSGQQGSPATATAKAPAEAIVCGVSGFAFQGTNAHVLMASAATSAGPDPQLADGDNSIIWRKARHWVHSRVSPLLRRSLTSGSTLVFETPFAMPSAAASLPAALWQASKSMAVVPLSPGLLLATAAAAVQAAITVPEAAAAAAPLLLVDGQLQGLLPPTASTDSVLQCRVDSATGGVQLTLVAEASSVLLLQARCSSASIVSATVNNAAAATASLARLGQLLRPAHLHMGTIPAAAALGAQVEDATEADLRLAAGVTTAAQLAGLVSGRAQRGNALVGFGACLLDLQEGTMASATEASLVFSPTVLAAPALGLQLQDPQLRPVTELKQQWQADALEAAARSRASGAITAGAPMAECGAEQLDHGVEYMVEWQAETPAPGLSPATAAPATPVAHLAPQDGPGNSATASVATAIASVQAALQGSGKRATGAEAGKLGLETVGAHVSSYPHGNGVLMAGGASAAAAWAVARTLAQEQPGLQLDAHDMAPAASASHLQQSPTTGAVQWISPTPQSSGSSSSGGLYGSTVTSGASFVARLVPAPAAASSSLPAQQPTLPALPCNGTYVITGGSGMAAAHMAAWLAAQGVRHVHLVSRSGALPNALLTLATSASTPPASHADDRSPTTFTASKADLSSSEDGAWLLRSSNHQLPILGIMHAAGVLEDALLPSLTLSSLRRVVAPKAASLTAWQQASLLHPAAAHVLFSSVASLLGSPGQAAYSAANATLDMAAAVARVAGQPLTSIQFGPWAGAGMASRHASTSARMERMGLALLQPAQALAAVSAAVQQCTVLLREPAVRPPGQHHAQPLRLQPAGDGVLAANAFRWPAFMAAMQRHAGSGAQFFSRFSSHALLGATDHTAGSQQQRQAQRPRAAAAASVDVGAAVTAAVSNILGDGAVSEHQPLMEAGLDSLGAVELTRSLEAALGLQLPQTLVFDYPTPAALTEHLQGLTQQQQHPEPHDAAVAIAAPPAMSAGAFPTRATSPAQQQQRATVLVQSLVHRSPPPAPGNSSTSTLHSDPVSTVPFSRWDVDAAPARALDARIGAYLPAVDLFDAALFGVSDAEAALLDPQQRLLMEGLHEALAAAAASAAASEGAVQQLSSRAVGVYVGVASSDYGGLVKAHGGTAGAFHATANALSVTAGRLSYTFGLTGKLQAVAVPDPQNRMALLHGVAVSGWRRCTKAFAAA